jgi:hypothetical protein
MFSWMAILAITVIIQRRKRDKEEMKEKWKEMKEKDAGRGSD